MFKWMPAFAGITYTVDFIYSATVAGAGLELVCDGLWIEF